MRPGLIIGGLAGLLLATAAPATTLPPELKAYDFGQAYYVEDGGVVIVPYDHGFSCADGTMTPEGIRIMPGGTFRQYDSGREVDEEYQLVRLSADGTQAFFHERLYRCHVARDARGRTGFVRDRLFTTTDFYLSRDRGLEWFDFAFPQIELHPGVQEWRSKNYFSGGR